MKTKSYSIYILFLIALGVYLFYAIIFNTFQQIYLPNVQPPDTSTYLQSVKMLYNDFEPHHSRPMGLAFLLGIPYGFCKSADIVGWGYFLNSFCWLCTCLLVYKTVCISTKNINIALLSGVFFAISIGSFFITTQILSESVFYFFFMLSFFFAVKFILYKQNTNAFFSLFFLSFSVIIRPGAYYLYLFLSLIAILYFLKSKNSRIVLLLLFTYCPIFFQSYKMKVKHNVYTVSLIDKGALINYWFARANYFKNGTTFEQENTTFKERMKGIEGKELGSFASQEFKYQIRNNSANLIKAYFYSMYENSKGLSSPLYDLREETFSSSTIVFKKVLLYLSRVQNIVFTFLGLFIFPIVLFKFRKKMSANIFKISLLGNVFTLYVVLTSAISYWQNDRFHLVFYPIVICILAFLHHEYWSKRQTN